MKSYSELNLDKAKKANRGFFGFFVNRHKFIVILLIAIIVWGSFSLFSLPREANPEVKIPYIIVTTLFPGASPTDIEDLVTDKIEEKVKNIENVKLITSTSQLSVSTVSIEFEASADLDKSLEEVKDAVDTVNDLPEDAEDPVVADVNFNNQSVVTISILGNFTAEEFLQISNLIEDELEGIGGVSRIDSAGVREKEIAVELNQGELDRFNISINEVSQALQLANISLPLGDIEVDRTVYNVRATGKFNNVQDLRNTVIRNTAQGVILLSDIANITERLQEETTISRISVAGSETLPAISFQVFKKTGGNIIEIVDSVKIRLDELRESSQIPETAEIVVTNDLSQFIRNDINTLGSSGIQTVFIIFILLTLALNFRQGMIGAISIPLVFLMSFGFLAATGSTLNSLTLFSLVLSMGLLVDTMIVVLEGIHDGLKQGMNAKNAALYSIETYKKPITAGVLTTISAFVPMFLVSGILGEFLKTFPTTITITLASSLFVALIILPGMMAFVLRKYAGQNHQEEKKSVVERYVIDKISPIYTGFLNKLLQSKKKKWTAILSLFAVLFISIATIPAGLIGVELFPKIDLEYFFVGVEMPVGTTLEDTEKITELVENQIKTLPEVENFVTNIGIPPVSFDSFVPGQGNANTAQIVVNLVDESERGRKSFDVASELRKNLATITEAKVTVEEVSGGPPTGSPIEVRVLGDSLDQIRTVASRLALDLDSIEGTVNVQTDERITPPEFEFVLDHQKLGTYGLDALTVASSIRAALEGLTATSINIDDTDVDVVLSIQNADNLSIEGVENLSITSRTGQTVKLGQVANFNIAPALENIRHRDLKQIISIRSDVEGTNAQTVNAEFNKKLEQINIPNGVEVQVGGEVEDIDQSFTELWYSMSVAVLLIFLIMVLQFDSFGQPFIILLTLPFAVIGVIVGTLILNLSFGFGTFLGIVALSGIVVNDAIVLIDRVNYNLYTRFMDIREAITEAGEARLQPIIITTLTTIAGVTPLGFVDEFWRGLSVSIGFGIAFATILTLVIMPMLYVKFQGKRWMRKKQEIGIQNTPTPPDIHIESI